VPALARALPGCVEAALSGMREAMGSGPKGNKLVDIEAVLLSVEPKLDVASDVGWRIAGARALIKACEAANTALHSIEREIEVVVPDDSADLFGQVKFGALVEEHLANAVEEYAKAGAAPVATQHVYEDDDLIVVGPPETLEQSS